MLMFQSGLLETFIPEILMVLGYLFCIFVPSNKVENETFNINSTIVHVTDHVRVQNENNSITTYDYQLIVEVEPELGVIDYFPKEIAILFHPWKTYVSDRISFVQFSRPPPTLFS